jgi:hypothetical protein
VNHPSGAEGPGGEQGGQVLACAYERKSERERERESESERVRGSVESKTNPSDPWERLATGLLSPWGGWRLVG